MDTLQSLLDAQQITQLLLKYPVALDSRDFDLLESLFTADARIDIPVAGSFDPRGYRHMLEQGQGRLDATQHFVGQPLLHIDGERAAARSYLYAQHVVNALAPNGTLLIGAWYNDELRRVGGRWLISSRTGNSVWWSGNPAVLGLDGVPQAFARGPGHDAPPWLKI
ncbi:MAG: nuclear transport factor 2 family protein [Gammaproteobacteria bacterium]|nr:nuclear transport factor 2 family protein [Gammaproteobacteria bacterium]